MFRSAEDAKAAEGNSVTIIGPQVNIDGDVAFSGDLRVQGRIVGNITCRSEFDGTTVIHASGSVSGTIKSPRIVIAGRVHGPVHTAESLEIQRGATLVGDASYQRIVIRAGGVIEGSLIPTIPATTDAAARERRLPRAEPPAVDIPETNGDVPVRGRFLSGRRFALAMALVVAAAGAGWWMRLAPTAGEPARIASGRQDGPVAPAVPAVVDRPAAVVPAATAVPATPDSPKTTANSAAAVPPPADEPLEDPGKEVTAHGMEADKPAGFFFVETREPAVLFIKNRNDPSEGTRLEFPRRTKKKVSIAKNEVVRVAQGRNTFIFYQGRKLSPRTIERGAWIGFVPAPRSGEE